MFKNALVSVSDKTGLVEALRPLVAAGLRVVSTGGTASHLKENGISVIDVSEQTGFPEILDGRVKTLHPKVHMALLARRQRPSDLEILRQNQVEPFDLVIGNLYPFEEYLKNGHVDEEMIEKIDIGGPSFLRAAAKNFQSIAVFCDPKDYSLMQQGSLSLEGRQELAAKVFYHISSYDAMIAKSLHPHGADYWAVGGKKVQELRYGENPQQSASWFSIRGAKEGLHKAKILQGKALSYNNILDLDAAVALVREFSNPCVVAVKHNNPCGAATAGDLMTAAQRALQADPVSVFGGIVALNRAVDKETAEILSGLFLECIVAPEISVDAISVFHKKKNLRILEWPGLMEKNSDQEVRSVPGGLLLQTRDNISEWDDSWKIVGQNPDSKIRLDLVFANKVAAVLKSNAIALAFDQRTVGLGMGQVNRVDSVAHAIERWKKHQPQVLSPVVASDAFFPFPDSIELLAKQGIKWIIQPGGSMNDEAVFLAAEKNNVNLIITGQRHFRH